MFVNVLFSVVKSCDFVLWNTSGFTLHNAGYMIKIFVELTLSLRTRNSGILHQVS